MAARENEPEERGAYLRPEEENDTLGPCGCVDYHMADCPTRTGYSDYLNEMETRSDQDAWYDMDY